MKSAFLIAASLIVGTAAIAQTTTTPTDAAPTATTATDSAMQAPATDPAAATPAADASAAPAPAPAGGMNAMPTPTTADMSSYPACSRSVQDHCVQRGKRR